MNPSTKKRGGGSRKSKPKGVKQKPVSRKDLKRSVQKKASYYAAKDYKKPMYGKGASSVYKKLFGGYADMVAAGDYCQCDSKK
jgi:hypothetical protein